MGRLRESEKPKLSKTCHVRLGQVPIAPPSFSTILFLNFVYKLFYDPYILIDENESDYMLIDMHSPPHFMIKRICDI